MDLEHTYGEWLAERIADQLVASEAIRPDQRDDVAVELGRLSSDGWWFVPPGRGEVPPVSGRPTR